MIPPDDNDDDMMSTDEMAMYARGLRKSALRESHPDIVAQSDGRDAAAYHAPAAAPPPGIDCTIPSGGVELSETLQRELVAGSAPAEPPAMESTVPASPKSTRRHHRALWMVAVVGTAAALAIGAAAMAGSHERKSAGGAHTSSTAAATVTSLPALTIPSDTPAPTVAPEVSVPPPAASQPPSAKQGARRHTGTASPQASSRSHAKGPGAAPSGDVLDQFE